MGNKASAIQIGSGINMTSTKQVVGRGEERGECGPWEVLAVSSTAHSILQRIEEGMTYEAFWAIAAEHRCW